jgi:hypothetical protein
LALRAILVVSVTVACAVEAPPPGGPVDDVAPTVVGTSPSPDSAGIDPGAEIAITFSEDMSRTGLERLFNTSPPIKIGRVRWDGRTVYIEPLEPLHPDTTYIATLSAGFSDNHRVRGQSDYVWAFATSTAIDSGTISGQVYFRREPTAKALARCFLLPVDSAFAPQAARPDREAHTDESGEFTLRYLPSHGSRFLVWAFEDKNANGELDPASEYGASYPDTVVLTPVAPYASGVDVWIVDPTEPAKLAGVAVNRSGLDVLPLTVTLSPDTSDTPAYVTACDTTGAFSFAGVRMGRYVVRAFVDVSRDSVCSWYPCLDDTTQRCQEPCTVMPDTLTVAPGDEIQVDSLFVVAPPRREGAGD